MAGNMFKIFSRITQRHCSPTLLAQPVIRPTIRAEKGNPKRIPTEDSSQKKSARGNQEEKQDDGMRTSHPP
jgi:hypothetical protein